MARRVPTSTRGRVAVAGAVAGAALVLCSPLLGRADVAGYYRPLLPPDGLTSGCYPLPGGVVPDFPYVLRRDSDMLTADGLRRRLVLHVDRLGAAEALDTITRQLAAAGVAGQVRVRARDLDVPPDAVVRAEMVLDLPVVARQSDAAVCSDPATTKRFTPDLPDDS